MLIICAIFQQRADRLVQLCSTINDLLENARTFQDFIERELRHATNRATMASEEAANLYQALRVQVAADNAFIHQFMQDDPLPPSYPPSTSSAIVPAAIIQESFSSVPPTPNIIVQDVQRANDELGWVDELPPLSPAASPSSVSTRSAVVTESDDSEDEVAPTDQFDRFECDDNPSLSSSSSSSDEDGGDSLEGPLVPRK